MVQPDNLLEADGTKSNATFENSSLNKTREKDESKKDIPKPLAIKEPLAKTATLKENIAHTNEESNVKNQEEQEEHTIISKDYQKFSLDELVLELEKLVKNEKIQTIKKQVDEIKNEFNLKFTALLEEKKQDFISKGGNKIDFYYSTPLQRSFKEAYHDFRTRLNTHYKSLEKDLKNNLSIRLEIIEEIKTLMNDAENSIHSKYKEFKDLQERWKNAGSIPRDKYNNAWNSYHFNVEKFYELLHLDRDLRDKDFKHNLEKKTKIIERAEELAKDDNSNHAFRELQVLHKLWKEDLGPVAKEHREVIWDRFKIATKKINDKRQEYYTQLESIFEQNLVLKNDIITQIKASTSQTVNSHSGWQNKIKEIEALRDQFFKVGKVPLKVNEVVWDKFKESVREFNHKKNGFYKNLKKDQFENLKKKQALIKIAETNKDNEDFEATTPLMKKIQNDWKLIGHVPRKESDKIWKQFKNACNVYFDRIKEQRHAVTEEEEKILIKKEALLEELKELTFNKNQKTELSTIKEYITRWKALGRVPFKKRKIEADFNKVLDHLFKDLDLNKNEAEMIKFENKLQDLSSAEDSRTLDNERSFIKKKVDEIKSEINQLENNLQFFKHADESNPLVKSVHNNIEKHKNNLVIWEKKLKKIKELY